MTPPQIAADALTPEHLRNTPLWRFLGQDEAGETRVVPLRTTHPRSLHGVLIGTTVHLSDGTPAWAILSNVDPKSPRSTQHFLTISLWTGVGWFHLARYHDPGFEKWGPSALARQLQRPLGNVFPISYDLRPLLGVKLGPTGTIPAVPPERLSRAQLIALAVPQR